MEKETPGRDRSFDLIGQGFEVHTALFQVTYDVDQVSNTTPQPVELLHDQGVVFLQHIQRQPQTYP